MLLKYFYDEALAHASYLVGCQRAHIAVVIDPGRAIEAYLEVAEREGLKITAVAETHIHADYVSGARELAERVGAKLLVSDEGPVEWKYQFLDDYDHRRLHDGDHVMIGNVRLDVMHTPGHTPESISFVLTDQGGGADQPMGIFTGDFVFVGSIGRPDLLEQAAGIADTAEPGARDLFRSVERFKTLPDYLQVWPAHGAGSACGKGLGAIPSSTVGYEKRFNPALQFDSEDEFVRYILADQPEAPKYFAVMKRVNKEGPRILGEFRELAQHDVLELPQAVKAGTVIDLARPADFAAGHVPGTINIPPGMLAAWAGWLVDYDRPLYLIGQADQMDKATTILHEIGVEQIDGWFDSAAARSSGLAGEHYDAITPSELAAASEAGEITVIDVRSDAEWEQGHLADASHHFLGRLPDQLDMLRDAGKVAVHCQRGARSAIAASVLQAAGIEVLDLTGGYEAWLAEGLPAQSAQSQTPTPIHT